MRNYLLAIAASAFLITACGEDNPSSANSVSNDDPMSRTGSLYVDESQQLLVSTFNDVHGNRCDLENNNLIWKSIQKDVITDSTHYEFIGDTLVLYDIYDGTIDDYGDLYVGGTAGNIYGTWVYTGFGRSKKTGEKERSTNTRYVTQTYSYSPGKVTTKVEYHMDLYVADEQARGYMESGFMADLYSYLTSRSYLKDVIYIMDNEDRATSVSKSIEKNNVQIIESTKTNQTFKIGDKTYTVTVKKAETTLHYTGRTNREAVVEVTDGTTTCSSYAIYKTVDENLCKTENLPYFSVNNDHDDYGNLYFYVSSYKNTDHEKFLECLSSIALPITNVPAPSLVK